VSGRHVTVIDYGIGNLLNVVRALEHCGASVQVADQAAQVTTLPDRLVLPGVGAFADAMAELRLRGFDELVKRYADTGVLFWASAWGPNCSLKWVRSMAITSGWG
jgi:glutamine amidotransferase